MGLKRGALASSYAHDSHNVIVVGVDDSDMLAAARQVATMQGGLVAVAGGEVLAELPLPVAGIMSTESAATVSHRGALLNAAALSLGATMPEPFAVLSFLALPVIPSLRLTDMGLVDVERGALYDLDALSIAVRRAQLRRSRRFSKCYTDLRRHNASYVLGRGRPTAQDGKETVLMSSKARVGLTVLLFAFLAAGLSAVACGGGSSTSNTPTPGTTVAPGATATKPAAAPSSTPGTAPKSASVTIKDFEFTPATITISVGGTVTWTNDGPSTHTATADDGSFDSGNLAQGKTFSHTFQSAGTFAYHCTPHPFMKATVIVQSGSTAVSPGY